LQDQKRAIVVGTKTFGKGSVQTILPLNAEGDKAIRLTTARYYTPSGRSIQAEGIKPDIEIKPAKIEQLDPVLSIEEADLKGALKNNDSKAEKPEKFNKDKTENKDEIADYQLDRAVDLLRGIALYSKTDSNVKKK